MLIKDVEVKNKISKSLTKWKENISVRKCQAIKEVKRQYKCREMSHVLIKWKIKCKWQAIKEVKRQYKCKEVSID